MSFCAAATIINVYAKHQYSKRLQWFILPGAPVTWRHRCIVCLLRVSQRRERRGVRARTPGWYRSLLFLVCTLLSSLHCTSLILHNIPQLMSNKLDSIVLFTPQSDCPRKCINAYYVEWRLCGLLQHIGAVSTRDRTGCDGVMLCTGSVQVYTNFQRSSSPARSPHIWSWVCSLSSRWSPLSLSLSLVHRIYPSNQDTKAVAICEINKMI